MLEALRAGDLTLVACERLLDEFSRALNGPYFEWRLSPERRRQVDLLVRGLAVTLPDPADPPPVLRDPRDDYLIELAADGSAEAIITGDKDLLEHSELRPPALTPREACERFLSD